MIQLNLNDDSSHRKKHTNLPTEINDDHKNSSDSNLTRININLIDKNKIRFFFFKIVKS